MNNYGQWSSLLTWSLAFLSVRGDGNVRIYINRGLTSSFSSRKWKTGGLRWSQREWLRLRQMLSTLCKRTTSLTLQTSKISLVILISGCYTFHCALVKRSWGYIRKESRHWLIYKFAYHSRRHLLDNVLNIVKRSYVPVTSGSYGVKRNLIASY